MMLYYLCVNLFFFFKQKTAYEMRISDWSSDVCSSDLVPSSVAGVVKELRVKLGDSVSEGDVIAVLEAEGEAAAKPASKVEQPATQKPEPIGRASCRERVCQYV